METWRPIPGYEGQYSVSDCGRIRSEERRCFQGRWGRGSRLVPGKILAQNLSKKGYMRAKVANRSVRVHVIVLEAFSGPRPTGMETLHLNGNPSDNRVSNLVWGTSKQNAADRKTHGRTLRGRRVAGHHKI